MNCELFINWTVDKSFHLFGLTLHWYSMCWLVGLALAYIVVRKLYKHQKIDDNKFDPLFIYCFLGILIGARLGHCIFYEPDKFLTSWQGIVQMILPIKIDATGSWHLTGYEGLASHGGTLGLMIALWLYVKKTGVKLWTVLDNIAIATGTTACFIRLGNLMNSEIVGRVTDVPWAFIFVNGEPSIAHEPRHPAQLYEALAYALLFIIMICIYLWQAKRNNPKQPLEKQSLRVGTGFYFGFCLTYIFTFRFFIEFLKENQVAFEDKMTFDMGQLLSIPFVILGVWCMIKSKKVKG